jgi:hypothetical protein
MPLAASTSASTDVTPAATVGDRRVEVRTASVIWRSGSGGHPQVELVEAGADSNRNSCRQQSAGSEEHHGVVAAPPWCRVATTTA